MATPPSQPFLIRGAPMTKHAAIWLIDQAAPFAVLPLADENYEISIRLDFVDQFVKTFKYPRKTNAVQSDQSEP
jgi:hypothetical protein